MKFKFVVGVLLVVVAAMCLCACAQKNLTLTEDEQYEISYAYAQEHSQYEKYFKFGGYFDGLLIIVSEDRITDTTENITTKLILDDVEFDLDNSKQFVIYYEDEFRDLQYIFDLGLLTHDNLLTLQYYYNLGVFAYIEEEFPYDEYANIVHKYVELHDLYRKDLPFDCYGKFKGTYVLRDKFLLETGEITNLTVDGVKFTFGGSKQFIVYRDGEFCFLQEAFDRGWLTHSNLRTVKRNYIFREKNT